MAITILVADNKTASRQELVRLLGSDREMDVVGEATDGREAIEIARSLRPAIILLDGSIIGLDAISVVEQLQVAVPETAVITVIDGANMELMRRLMRAGARDCVVKPIVSEELVNTIRTVHSTMQKQRQAQGTAVAPTQQSNVIAVYSPQGGAGKSVLAANLSVAMAQASGANKQRSKVALVDLNLQFGDIDLMLNLTPQNTIAGLAQKSHAGVDSELVEQFLTVHEESGLRVLVAPSTPQYAESVTVYTVEQIIEALRGQYQYVILDTPSQLQDTTLAALDAANTILLLTTLDLLALHKTRTALEMLRQLYAPEKIQVVLNRANSEVGISVGDVEEALGVPLRAQIPSDGRVVVTSVNEGRPFVLSSQGALIARRISTLALELLGQQAPVASTESGKKEGGLLKKLFG